MNPKDSVYILDYKQQLYRQFMNVHYNKAITNKKNRIPKLNIGHRIE